MESFSPSTANELVFSVGASGFPAVADRWVPWLVSGVEVDFDFFSFFFFETEEGVTHSLVDGILMECGLHEYRCRIVDANVNRVLPREVAQAVMVRRHSFNGVLVRDVGKELPRVEPGLSMLFGSSKPKARLETFPACICSGDTLGTTIVPRCSPYMCFVLSVSFFLSFLFCFVLFCFCSHALVGAL